MKLRGILLYSLLAFIFQTCNFTIIADIDYEEFEYEQEDEVEGTKIHEVYSCFEDLCTCNRALSLVVCVYNQTKYPDRVFPYFGYAEEKIIGTLIIDSFPEIPDGAIQSYSPFLENESILITILSAKRIKSDAFWYLEDADIKGASVTCLNSSRFENSAFNHVKLVTLTIGSIQLSDDTSVYKFNWDSLAGAQSIETLELIDFGQVKGFESDLSEVDRSVEITNLIIDGIDVDRLDGKIWSTPSVQFNKIKNLIWYSVKLTAVSPYTFSKMDSLESLSLRGCSITKLYSNTFYHSNSQLLELDLSDNPIESMSFRAFDALEKLKILSLDNIRVDELHKNTFKQLTNLESLSVARQRVMKTFNWESILDLPKLTTIDLSFYSAGKFAITYMNIETRKKVKKFINNQLKSVVLNGYEFTDEDMCYLLPSLGEYNSSSFPFFQLDRKHKCSCFVIMAFKYYREQFKETDHQEFYEKLDDAPSCYFSMYNNTSNFETLPEIVVFEEEFCIERLEVLCSLFD